jgi:hypothetical protein
VSGQAGDLIAGLVSTHVQMHDRTKNEAKRILNQPHAHKAHRPEC